MIKGSRFVRLLCNTVLTIWMAHTGRLMKMIYHAAGTQSGQYVDDREFLTSEDAGYVPVRRTNV